MPDIYGSDTVVEETIGFRLKHYRLERNFSQTELSERAGIARRTITSVENGKGCTLSTLIRLLRALNKLDLLHGLLEEPPLRPSQMKEIERIRESPRKYASKPRKKREPADTGWVWGDER